MAARNTLPHNLPKIIVVVGPTASGKTALAHKIAKKFNGDIICADSRQVFRGADVGTAKPRCALAKHPERLRVSTPCKNTPGVRHYGIDLVGPDEYFSVQQWKRSAEDAIREIRARGRIPIIEGGTWLWVFTITHNLTIPEVPPDKKLRARLEHRISKKGLLPLIKEIKKKDPEALRFLDLHNPRRIIRTLEVIRTTTRRFSELRKAGPPKYAMLILGLNPLQQKLERAIAQRVKTQLRQGLMHETQRLAKKFGWSSPALSGIGYREWHWSGKRPVSEVQKDIVRHTKNLTKMQLRMFGRHKKIHWIKTRAQAYTLVSLFLKNNAKTQKRP